MAARRLRILHVINRYWPAAGGAETHLHQLSRRLVQDGHAVTVATTDADDYQLYWRPNRRRLPDPESTHDGVRILRFPVRHVPLSPHSYWAWRIAIRLLSDARVFPTALLHRMARLTPRVPGLARWLAGDPGSFDIVGGMALLYEPIFEAGLRFAQRRGLPFAAFPLTHLGAGPRPGADPISRYYTMRHQVDLVRRSQAVLAQTGAERNFYAARGVAPAHITIAGPGVDPALAHGGDGARFRQRHNLHGPLVAFMGALTYDKGALHTAQAVARLAADAAGGAPAAVFAGTPSPEFERGLAALPPEARGRLHLLGHVGDDDKRDMLAACDLLAMPSRSDSFGITFLEAWLYGKPVIGSTAYGMADVITDGADGLLVPFGDVDALSAAMRRLLSDPGQSARLGDAGRRKTLAAHTWEHKYALVRDVYAGLVTP